jgi:hypothetical protein
VDWTLILSLQVPHLMYSSGKVVTSSSAGLLMVKREARDFMSTVVTVRLREWIGAADIRRLTTVQFTFEMDLGAGVTAELEGCDVPHVVDDRMLVAGCARVFR